MNLNFKWSMIRSTAAKIAQEPAFELKEDPEHLGDREDYLAVRNIQEERLPHPRRPGPRLCPGVYFRREGSSLDSPHSSRRLTWQDGQKARVLREKVRRCSDGRASASGRL